MIADHVNGPHNTRVGPDPDPTKLCYEAPKLRLLDWLAQVHCKGYVKCFHASHEVLRAAVGTVAGQASAVPSVSETHKGSAAGCRA